MTNGHDVLVVAALGSLASRTRLIKFARLYSNAGRQVNHLAWMRSTDRSELDAEEVSLGVRRKVIARGGTYGGTSSRRLLPAYARWVVSVFFELVRQPASNVHALGLESALPALLAAKLRRHRVIYDDADRFSFCHPMPARVKSIVAATERWVARHALVHVVPGVGRYPDGLPARTTIELPNWPSEPDVVAAKSVVAPEIPQAELTLYANGWIGDRRGAVQLLEMSTHLRDDSRFHLVVAGRITESAADELVTLSNVTNLGKLSQAEALAVYSQVDAVVTMYDPSVAINRFAEPNKWGDCLELGVPILVNEEVQTAAEVIGNGYALSFAWEGAGLTDLIDGLLLDRTPLENATAAIAAADFSDKSFDRTVKEQLIPLLLKA